MMARIIFGNEPYSPNGYCLGLQQDFADSGYLAVWDLESSTKKTLSFSIGQVPAEGIVETPMFLINQYELKASGFTSNSSGGIGPEWGQASESIFWDIWNYDDGSVKWPFLSGYTVVVGQKYSEGWSFFTRYMILANEVSKSAVQSLAVTVTAAASLLAFF